MTSNFGLRVHQSRFRRQPNGGRSGPSTALAISHAMNGSYVRSKASIVDSVKVKIDGARSDDDPYDDSIDGSCHPGQRTHTHAHTRTLSHTQALNAILSMHYYCVSRHQSIRRYISNDGRSGPSHCCRNPASGVGVSGGRKKDEVWAGWWWGRRPVEVRGRLRTGTRPQETPHPDACRGTPPPHRLHKAAQGCTRLHCMHTAAPGCTRPAVPGLHEARA